MGDNGCVMKRRRLGWKSRPGLPREIGEIETTPHCFADLFTKTACVEKINMVLAEDDQSAHSFQKHAPNHVCFQT